MSQYLDVIQVILEGLPWTLESAKAKGFQAVDAARVRPVSFSHFMDDEEEWAQPDRDFEAAVEELSSEWGPPLFEMQAKEEFLCFAGGDTERVAGWEHGDHIIFVKLCYGDNTRIKMLDVGVMPKEELKPPIVSEDWWEQPPWQPES